MLQGVSKVSDNFLASRSASDANSTRTGLFRDIPFLFFTAFGVDTAVGRISSLKLVEGRSFDVKGIDREVGNGDWRRAGDI